MDLTVPDIMPLPAMRGEALWERWRLHWWSGSWFRQAPPWTNQPHRHRDYHELCLATHGRGRFDHGDEVVELVPGTAFVSDLDVVHEISCRDRALALVFFGLRLERLASGRERRYGDRVCARFVRAHRCAVLRPGLLAYLPALCAPGGDAALRHRRTGLVETFLVEALAALLAGEEEPFDPGAEDSPHGRVEAALRHLDRHLDRPVAVAELAASVGLGERQLRRLFEDQLGTTVVAAMRDRRLDAGCKLLAMRLPVAEVARRVGIGSGESFARAFRRRYGCSPREYQQRNAPRVAVRLTTFGPAD